MLPLSTEADVIIPKIPSSIPQQTQREEIKQDTQLQVDICKEQPYLFYCKNKPKLRSHRRTIGRT